ncbi:hypothetical protein A3A74_00340 [Candidatus Roizmanbacteria bacterium RIFCSPLOWO2_01_FULL_35_13]|uniref:Polymerase nucleotidyl transferase domain-containing protein n=1 Tax=Candidatus Roizmanbacteria bacterium RIFCSPLOWO2_01_FULL_35_13 TaxID=1802055 RepID=A0A1F7IB37_9BACT|nr:MAG: hypothetical protein A3A74_00340 [Candidatus Roizmanbacteria bacterium RIFCSPLOWO2_01_FULL_35_13]
MGQIRNWKLEIGNLEKEILSTLQYFLFFNYPPTFEEIYTFLRIRASKRQITGILEKMKKRGIVTTNNKIQSTRNKQYLNKNDLKIKNLDFNINFNPFGKLRIDTEQSRSIKFQISNSDRAYRYTLGEYIKNNNQQSTINNYLKRQQISINKLSSWKFNLYVKLLSLVPSVKLVGLSGSVAMLNADDDHDIDLFIITAKNRLWIGRFVALLLAQLLRIRRARHSGKRSASWRRARPESSLDSGVPFDSAQGPQNDAQKHKNKVCLNLFFDESDLKIPKFKQTEYVAHEILQMKPLVDKDGTYLMFIDTNKWVFDIFPNAKNDYRGLLTDYRRYYNPRKSVSHPWRSIFNKIEQVLKKLQLSFIRKHQTSEIVTDFQLWFHPDDFEKKMKFKR